METQCDGIDPPPTVLAVRENMDGYWYIGAGRRIADGPYRYPQQLLTVASDLLSREAHWRIDVYDSEGRKIMSYSSREMAAKDLDLLSQQRRWGAIPGSSPVNRRYAG